MISVACPTTHSPAAGSDGARSRREVDQPLGFGGSVAMSLWCSFLLLSPIYLMPSGLPQLADAAIVILFPLLLLLGGFRIPRKAFPVVNALSLFMFYAVAVSVTWTMLLSDTQFLRRASYFIFNFGVCLTCVALYGRYGRRAVNWTAAAVCLSILIQAILTTRVTGTGEERVTGFFNNPNQLGYFAVLYGSLFWVWSDSADLRGALRKWLPLCIYAGALFLAVQSLSRAATGAALLLVFLAGMRNKTVVVAGLLGACLLGLLGTHWQKVEEFDARVERKSRGVVEEVLSRGYDRLLNHPEYLLLGAGEGALYRIKSRNPIELHSSLGTVLFSYGIVGMALFLYIFVVMAEGCGASSLMYFLPVGLYGMVHMGLRQSELWILPVLVVCIRWPENQPEDQPSRARLRRDATPQPPGRSDGGAVAAYISDIPARS